MDNKLALIILAIVGMVIQLLFKFLPALAPWYEKQSQKALIMVGFILVVSLAYFGLGCVSFLAEKLGIQVACTLDGSIDLTIAFVWILMSQQVTYVLTRKTQSVG